MIHDHFDAVGLIRPKRNVKTFAALDDALEWTEDEILKQESERATEEEKRLSLGEIELFSGIPGTMLEALSQATEERSKKHGEKIFSQGERGDELFLIRKGLVRILLPLEHDKNMHLATFGQGDFFGDMSFLDDASRSADAVIETDADLYVISRKKFDALADQYPDLGKAVFFRLAHCLAERLRHTDAELRALEEEVRNLLYRSSDSVFSNPASGEITIVMDDCNARGAEKLAGRLAADLNRLAPRVGFVYGSATGPDDGATVLLAQALMAMPNIIRKKKERNLCFIAPPCG